MLIYEKQYELNNPKNYQERTINSYDNFDEYLNYLTNDKSKELYPSLPRQAELITISKWVDEVEIEFINGANQRKYIHIGRIVK